MRHQQLAPAAWGRFLARISSERAGAPTSVRVAPARGRVANAGIATRPLVAIAFEHRAIELRVAGTAGNAPLRFFVDRPARLVALDAQGACELIVVDAGGTETLIRVGAPRRSGRRRRGQRCDRGAAAPRSRGRQRWA
jgi:hypothetical protein